MSAKRCMLVCSVLFVAAVGHAFAGWSTGWSYRQELTIERLQPLAQPRTDLRGPLGPEACGQRLVVGHGNLLAMHDPLAALQQRVDPPVNEQAAPALAEAVDGMRRSVKNRIVVGHGDLQSLLKPFTDCGLASRNDGQQHRTKRYPGSW